MHSRRKARIGVLGALYAAVQSHEDNEKILKDVYKREKYDKSSKNFIRSLFVESIAHADESDKLIEKYLKNWEFSRVALLDKMILRMSITEMLFIKDIPPKVAMSEAIEIAKEYSTEESFSFVNGILDSIYKQFILKKSKQVKAD